MGLHGLLQDSFTFFMYQMCFKRSTEHLMPFAGQVRVAIGLLFQVRLIAAVGLGNVNTSAALIELCGACKNQLTDCTLLARRLQLT
jgi:hypothetical protein